MRISDWSSDVCSSDLGPRRRRSRRRHGSGQVARRLVAHGGEAHAGGGVRLRRVDRRRHLSLGLRLRSHADSPFLPSASSADPSALTVVQGERPVPKLTIRQWPLPIETGKATILDAALDRGVPFPHGCRTGECGTCKCLLLSGDVAMKNYDSAALSASEDRKSTRPNYS